MEFFGIGGGELLLLLVLGVIIFGPEKLPEMSRKAARVIWVIRNIANQATDQLKEELGPEYKDLTLADLHPKTFVQKTILAEVSDDLADIRRELDDVKTDLGVVGKDLDQASKELSHATKAKSVSKTKPAVKAIEAGASMRTPAPFDDEAT